MTPADRATLEGRRRDLRASLKPGDVFDAAEAILGMFDGWVNVKMDREKARGVAATYGAQVYHLPLWAVQRGCAACVAENTQFPPSAGTLRAACQAAIVRVQEEIFDLSYVLDAKVYEESPKMDAARRQAVITRAISRISRRNPYSGPHRAKDKRDSGGVTYPEPVPDGSIPPPLSPEVLGKMRGASSPISSDDDLRAALR